jgi:hypothetical protein
MSKSQNCPGPSHQELKKANAGELEQIHQKTPDNTIKIIYQLSVTP